MIKGSLSSSWMNSPIPIYFCLCSKTSLCAKLLVWKYMSPVRSFTWKSSHFHVKRLKQQQTLFPPFRNHSWLEKRWIRLRLRVTFNLFSTSTGSKEANRNSEVEVKSACICMCHAAHPASTYSSFCSMWLEVFLLPPGWDASSSQGYPQHLICQYLFIHLSGYWGTVCEG